MKIQYAAPRTLLCALACAAEFASAFQASVVHVPRRPPTALAAGPPADTAEASKLALLSLAASYDRGYGATPAARASAADLVDRLGALPSDGEDPARGADGSGTAPLSGVWRMVWTTAPDLLVLDANPLWAVGAVYQDCTALPAVINVIDLVPRLRNLVPLSAGLPESRLRLEVTTRACVREEVGRVGLDFESVRVRPMEVLGRVADFLPRPKFDLPKVPLVDTSAGPGFFDILYLDDDMLITDQNAPGGIFVLVKVPEAV